MSNLKDLVKNGWHPEKQGTTLKGQVSSLMGRSKDSSSSSGSRADHVSRPLSELRDPTAFAPPPRRTNSSLAQTSPPAAASPVQRQQSPEAPPSRPFQRDTTGLSTSHLPPPPTRRDGADGRSTPSAAAASVNKPAPPSLPPRLPPRGATPNPPPPPPPPAASSHSNDAYLNQGAVTRLGAVGVSVPGLGIRQPSPAASTSPVEHGAPSGGGRFGSHVDALQNKFSTLGTPSSSSPTPPPNQGTTWAQKQATLKTASAFHKDPSSVSMSDARAAASTANNFRQRHGDQINAGVKRTTELNQKYAVMDKVGSYVNTIQGQAGLSVAEQSSPGTGLGQAGKKKPPPPPPKKKFGVGASSQSPAARGNDDGAPPPVPLSTRPAF